MKYTIAQKAAELIIIDAPGSILQSDVRWVWLKPLITLNLMKNPNNAHILMEIMAKDHNNSQDILFTSECMPRNCMSEKKH